MIHSSFKTAYLYTDTWWDLFCCCANASKLTHTLLIYQSVGFFFFLLHAICQYMTPVWHYRPVKSSKCFYFAIVGHNSPHFNVVRQCSCDRVIWFLLIEQLADCKCLNVVCHRTVNQDKLRNLIFTEYILVLLPWICTK